MEFPGFNFDTKYFKDLEVPKEKYEGGAVQFSLIGKSKRKYLTLYNFHNGYYSRGFVFSEDGKQIKEGSV